MKFLGHTIYEVNIALISSLMFVDDYLIKKFDTNKRNKGGHYILTIGKKL